MLHSNNGNMEKTMLESVLFLQCLLLMLSLEVQEIRRGDRSCVESEVFQDLKLLSFWVKWGGLFCRLT